MLADEELTQPSQILAALVATGVIEFKIALLRQTVAGSSRRIFHDKLGIFRDSEGNNLVFKGSMNETWFGLASDGNLESIDVACSWLGGRDYERTKEESKYFDDLWNDIYPGLAVRRFPEVAKETLVSASPNDWETTLECLLNENSRSGNKVREPDAKGRSLRPHQSAGLAAWRANERRGILAFATGAGKTFTALDAIGEALVKSEVPVVIVPDKTLFSQWYDELLELSLRYEAQILRVGSGHTHWRDVIAEWTMPTGSARIVIATIQTARTDEFLRKISGGEHLLLVADEVHRLGSERNRVVMDENLFGPRLGLSATPERAGDEEGTSCILSFFGGILEPRYSLTDAVRDGVLTRYFYRPHQVSLNQDEIEEWRSLSKKISRLRAQLAEGEPQSPAIQRLLFRRAGIVKKAQSKVDLARRVMRDEYQNGQRWIIYCDDQTQMQSVCQALEAEKLTPMPFHAEMEGDRQGTLDWLNRRGGIVVAIKCLDEGVDVPSVTHALILASSKNPREFIQRRGRVLRQSPGKSLAYVHDAIVVPPNDAVDSDEPDPITAGEMSRAIEFAENADNPAVDADLAKTAIDAGLDWVKMSKAGIEDEYYDQK
ncbi:MAG: DEAD/DEAH box helicase family protein [Verrucomicrobiota bacterium]